MTKENIALQYYNTIRTELTMHIRLRDQALFIYLGAISALYGITLGININLEVLLIIPFLVLGVTIIVTQHDSHIGALAAYCAKELGTALDGKGVSQWDNSEVMRAYEKRLVVSRYFGHMLIMLPPAVVALVVTACPALSLSIPMGFAWYSGLVATVVSFLLLINTAICRRSMQKKQKESTNNKEMNGKSATTDRIAR